MKKPTENSADIVKDEHKQRKYKRKRSRENHSETKRVEKSNRKPTDDSVKPDSSLNNPGKFEFFLYSSYMNEIKLIMVMLF